MKSNIAEFLPEIAGKYPDKKAVICKTGMDRKGNAVYAHLSFSQLNRLSDDYASEFRSSGIVKGTKILMMLKPGFDFIAAVFAVMKTGAVPVLIDPGMGKSNLLKCIRDTKPEAMIGIPLAHWIRLLYPKSFRSVKKHYTNGRFAPPWIRNLKQVRSDIDKDMDPPFEIENTNLNDSAAIVFTTGSTGPPKGVLYNHGIYISQLEIIKNTYGAGPEEVDMPAFPLFALFSTLLGMPCVIPDMNPSRPAKANPEKIIETIIDHNVSFSFASPALWKRVAEYCIDNNIKLPSLKKVLMAGAPVPADLHSSLKKIISHEGETLVPYGATESLPVTNFTGTEMLDETAERTAEGKGYCVGYPIEGITINIIEPVEGPISCWENAEPLQNGKIGEIVIKGPVVTPEYYNDADKTLESKISDSDGLFRHRIGDMGYFDEKGRLWFCGRKSHMILDEDATLYPVCCEAIFNHHNDVFRSALTSVLREDKKIPVLIVEPVKGKFPGKKDYDAFIEELKNIGAQNELTKKIEHFLFHHSFPVDIRHNAKIFREKLALWAEKQSIIAE